MCARLHRPPLPSLPSAVLQAHSQRIIQNRYTGGQKKFVSTKRNLFKVLGLFFSGTLAIHGHHGDGRGWAPGGVPPLPHGPSRSPACRQLWEHSSEIKPGPREEVWNRSLREKQTNKQKAPQMLDLEENHLSK